MGSQTKLCMWYIWQWFNKDLVWDSRPSSRLSCWDLVPWSHPLAGQKTSGQGSSEQWSLSSHTLNVHPLPHINDIHILPIRIVSLCFPYMLCSYFILLLLNNSEPYLVIVESGRQIASLSASGCAWVTCSRRVLELPGPPSLHGDHKSVEWVGHFLIHSAQSTYNFFL